jgi:3-phenylpropionate/trans-cinnamate dioxygenase ferredoxin component
VNTANQRAAASPWVDVGARAHVEPGMPLAVQVGELRLGIHEVAGQLHALEDTCPHAFALLTQGFSEGCEVECPLHGAVFDVPSGKHLRGEACRDLQVFPVRVVASERVEVLIK